MGSLLYVNKVDCFSSVLSACLVFISFSTDFKAERNDGHMNLEVSIATKHVYLSQLLLKYELLYF